MCDPLYSLDCGRGYCAQNEARCNGFVDCVISEVDEEDCGNVVGCGNVFVFVHDMYKYDRL